MARPFFFHISYTFATFDDLNEGEKNKMSQKAGEEKEESVHVRRMNHETRQKIFCRLFNKSNCSSCSLLPQTKPPLLT